MKRALGVGALLSVVCAALGCGNEAMPNGSGGASSTTTSGSGNVAGTSSGGAATGPGGASGSMTTAGVSGTVTNAGQNAGGVGTAGNAVNGGADAGSAGFAGSATGGSAGAGGASSSALPKRMLLYHFSTLVIDTVPAQLTFLKSQLMTWGYEVEDSVSPDDLSTANLARFGAVGMINTCFEPFGMGKPGDAQAATLKAFVENGGGLFGTHCAAVTFQSAEPPHPYNDVIGGRGGHGFFDGKSACRTTAQHVTSAMLPATFDFTGNLDNADYVAADSTVLVKCKWSGGDMKDSAVSWYRTPGKGRVFYTNFAKIDADLSDATLGAKHIVLGLGWVLGR